jgi:hypothetical protein
MTATADSITSMDWTDANRRYLEAELVRLRLLLQRRVLWLRQQWKHDPLQSYQGWIISDGQADWLLAGEDREAERRFYQLDPDAQQLTGALEVVGEHIVAGEAACAAAGAPPALQWLAQLFHLTRFERDVILLCLDPMICPACKSENNDD